MSSSQEHLASNQEKTSYYDPIEYRFPDPATTRDSETDLQQKEPDESEQALQDIEHPG